jgi:hypothetical protein
MKNLTGRVFGASSSLFMDFRRDDIMVARLVGFRRSSLILQGSPYHHPLEQADDLPLKHSPVIGLFSLTRV